MNAQDMREIAAVQEFIHRIKEENSVKIKENSNRIVVSNISSLVPRKIVDGLFSSLKANRTFKNIDLTSVSNEGKVLF